mgnify:CR=1 FL=1
MLFRSVEEFRAGGDREGDFLILEEGLTWKAMSLTLADMQWIESQKFSRSNIMMFYGVPPFLLGDTEKSTSWGSGIEQQKQGFLDFSAEDDLTMWEEAINGDLIIEPDVFARFNRARERCFDRGLEVPRLDAVERRDPERPPPNPEQRIALAPRRPGHRRSPLPGSSSTRRHEWPSHCRMILHIGSGRLAASGPAILAARSDADTHPTRDGLGWHWVTEGPNKVQASEGATGNAPARDDYPSRHGPARMLCGHPKRTKKRAGLGEAGSSALEKEIGNAGCQRARSCSSTPGGWGAEKSKASVRDRASEATITLSLRFRAAVGPHRGLIMSDWRNSRGATR